MGIGVKYFIMNCYDGTLVARVEGIFVKYNKFQNYQSLFKNNPMPFCILRVAPDSNSNKCNITIEYYNDVMMRLIGADMQNVPIEHIYLDVNSCECDCDGLIRDAALNGASGEFSVYSARMEMMLRVRYYQAEYGYCACMIEPLEMTTVDDAKSEIQHIYNMLPGAVFKCKCDPQFTISTANDNFFKFVGYTRDEYKQICNNSLMYIIYEEDRKSIYKVLNDPTNSDIIFSGSIRITCKNGNVKWVMLRAQLDNTQSNLEYIYCMLWDISTQREAEIKSLMTQDKYTQLLNAVPGGIAIYRTYSNDSSEIVYINDELCCMTGFSREELLNRGAKQVCMAVPEDQMLVRKAVDESKKNLQPVIVEYRTRMKDGSLRYIKMKASMKHHSNDICTTYVIYSDITEHKLAQHALQTQRQKTNLALQNANLTMWEYDILGHKIILQSNAINRLEVPDVIEDAPASVICSGSIYPESVADYLEMHSAVSRGEPSITRDICYIQSDGKPIWKRCTFTTVFDDNGMPTSAIGCAVNIDDVKKLERQFRDEIKYQEALQSDSLITKARINLTRNRVESYKAKCQYSVTYNGMAYDDAIRELMQNVLTEQQRNDLMEYISGDRLLDAYAHGETKFSIDYQRKTEDGNAIWVNLSIKNFQDPETGNILSFMYTYNVDNEKNDKDIDRPHSGNRLRISRPYFA